MKPKLKIDFYKFLTDNGWAFYDDYQMTLKDGTKGHLFKIEPYVAEYEQNKKQSISWQKFKKQFEKAVGNKYMDYVQFVGVGSEYAPEIHNYGIIFRDQSKNNKNVKIAKQLLKLAKDLVKLESNEFYIRGKQGELYLMIDSNSWNLFGKKPEWQEIVDVINEECKGNFYGVDHSCFKKKMDNKEFGILNFDGSNDENHKSPEVMIKQNLKRLGFIENKF